MSTAIAPPESVLAGAWAEAYALAEAELRASAAPVWTPQAGPQALAYHCAADVVGYGGEAGGGKTDLLIGVAGTQHRRAIIFRREFPRLEKIEARSREIFNAAGDARARDHYNESLHRWELATGATVRFAAMQYEDDKANYQGRDHDFYGFDEVTEFSETQVRFVISWNRSTYTDPRTGQPQKCQVFMTFNPPMDDAGQWVTVFFGPWVDPQHPHPAADGEIRWYTTIAGKDIECPSGEPFELGGEMVTPKSRTFYHASLKDNPILEATGYADQINAAPEPLRSILKGNFSVARQANPFQVIPAAWVRAANERWLARTADHGVMNAIGVDVSRGGADQTLLAPLYGDWFAPLLKYPGVSVTDGAIAASLVTAAIIGQPEPAIGVDIIGYGSSCYDSLVGAGQSPQGINFAVHGDWTDASGKYRMLNLRAAAYWRLREALDPVNGSTIALPPDAELLADLCAPTWHLDRGSGKVQIEDKDEVKKRLGRSPDCADAVVLAWWAAGEAGPWHW